MRSKLPLRIGKRCKRLVVSTRLHEPRTSVVRPGQSAASARTVGSGLRMVYGGFDTRDLKEAKALLEELA